MIVKDCQRYDSERCDSSARYGISDRYDSEAKNTPLMIVRT